MKKKKLMMFSVREKKKIICVLFYQILPNIHICSKLKFLYILNLQTKLKR